MQDDGGNPRSDVAVRPDSLGPGRALRSAREAQALSREQVAQDMHLDVWIVEAMERDDFAALGVPVFAKGYLRKYATLLGLAHDDLLVAYYRLQSKPETPALIATRKNVKPATRIRLLWVLVAVSIVAVAFVAWWLVQSGLLFASSAAGGAAPAAGSTPAGATAAASAMAVPPPARPADRVPTPQGETDGTATSPLAAESPAVPSDAESPDQSATAAQVAELPSGSGDATQLTLRYLEDSWTEVYDADGRRLIFGLAPAGSQRRASGKPPIEIYLGNAAGVEVYADGELVATPQGRRRGQVARFSIGERTASGDPQ